MNVNRLIRLSRSYWESKIIFTANNLKIFNLLKERKKAEEIAEILNLDKEETVRFLKALVSLKFLEEEDGYFKNSKFSNIYLVKGERSYLGDFIHHCENLWDFWRDLEDRIRYRKNLLLNDGQKEIYQHRLRDYLYAHHNLASLVSEEIAQKIEIEDGESILDLGGGLGSYTLSFLRKNPNIKATILDLKDVIEHTKKFLARYPLNNIRTISGNILKTKLKDRYDKIFISNLIHIYDQKENMEILKKCRDSLRRKGKLIIHNLLLNKDKNSPIEAVLFDINMLVGTVRGRVYSLDEVIDWLKRLEFKKMRSFSTKIKTKVLLAVI